MTGDRAPGIGPYDCVNCEGPVAATGECACNENGGPCAGVLVRPHMCNPAYRDPSVARSSYSNPAPARPGETAA